MQVDLNHHESQAHPFRSQVCIVGAGIAGLTLAHTLMQQGIDVAVLEAGGPVMDSASQSLMQQAIFPSQLHHGTQEGRFRAFGGASLRWGGQLLPLPKKTAWPDLDLYVRAAEEMLGVDSLPYAAGAFFNALHAEPLPEMCGLIPRLSKWTHFSRRNLADTIGRALLAGTSCTTYFNAQATELLLAPARDRVVAVFVRTLAGRTFRFEAPHIVAAAGTVETARLLLASRSVAPEGVGNQNDQVGRNFHDHLTLNAASIGGPPRASILEMLRPWICGATQHSVKLEATPQLRRNLGLNPVLAHIAFEDPEHSGLAVLRDVMTSWQRNDLASTLKTNVRKLSAAALDGVRIAASAKLRHRRYISPSTTVTLRFNVAQNAPSASRISLSNELDPFGQPRPIVDWQIADGEVETFRLFAQHMRSAFASIGLDRGIDWNRQLFTDGSALNNIDDARHAMGGACMGSDVRTSVVDENLRVHGISNLHVAGTAIFRDGSPQLPTLTMMAFTLRLAERLKMLL